MTPTFEVPSRAMAPTIRFGSTVKATPYGREKPQRFDVVVLGSPETARVFVFRVIGLPGEYVSLTPDGVSINGVRLESPQGIRYSSGSMADVTPKTEFRLGKKNYVVLGDNVAHARDSRFFGVIHARRIYGKVSDIQEAAPDEQWQ